MEAFLLILAVLLLAGGLIFSVLPPIPGPALAYLAMIVTHYASEETQFTTFWLIFFGISTVLILVIDFILPVCSNKEVRWNKSWNLGRSNWNYSGGRFTNSFRDNSGASVGSNNWRFSWWKSYQTSREIGLWIIRRIPSRNGNESGVQLRNWCPYFC